MAVLQARAAVRTNSTDAVFVKGAGHPREARNLLRALKSIRSRSWAGEKRSRWCCAMRSISRRVCAGGEVLDRLRRESSTILA
jgi:hypothetical protein